MSIALEEGVVVPLAGLKRTAARRMTQAWSAPVFHLTVEVDMTSPMRVKEIEPTATVTDAVVAAVAAALVEVPEVNVHVGEDAVTRFTQANIGIAVASPKGLVVPIVHDAAAKSLREVAAARAGIVSRARNGELTREDVTGGTFTVSNLGMMGVSRFDAILNVPQAAILAVGATVRRYVLRDSEPQWRPIAEFTLTGDHRALDGATGASFLAAVKRALEAPLL